MTRSRRALCLAVLAIVVLAVPAVADAATFQFVRSIAGQPDAGHPLDAAMDASGHTLVIDSNAQAIVRYAYDGSRTVLVPREEDNPFGGPSGIVVHPDGKFDVTDTGRRAIKRYLANGHLASTFTSTVEGSPVTPAGIAAVRDAGLVVVDAGNWRLLRFSGAPEQSIDPESSWSVLARDLPGRPADVVMLGSDRVLVSFPAAGSLVLFDAANGATLGSFGTRGSGPGQFDPPEDLLVHGVDVFVADGANNRIQVFPGMAAAGVRTFPEPTVVSTAGKTLRRPGCLFDTSAFTRANGGFGVCDDASLSTAGSVDLYTRSPTGTELLAGATASVEAQGATCTQPTQLGSVAAARCTRPTPSIGGVSGGALADLLLAAGGAVAAAIIAATSDDDFTFGGATTVVAPNARAFSAQRRAPRGRTVRIEPGQVVRLPLRATARGRKALRRALRKRRVVRRRVVIRITDTATGRTYKVRHTVVVRRRKR